MTNTVSADEFAALVAFDHYGRQTELMEWAAITNAYRTISAERERTL
jgi:hypothetical protein